MKCFHQHSNLTSICFYRKQPCVHWCAVNCLGVQNFSILVIGWPQTIYVWKSCLQPNLSYTVPVTFKIIFFHLLLPQSDSKQLLRIHMTGYYEPAVLHADDPRLDPACCYCRNKKKNKKPNLFLICACSLWIFSGQEADCSIHVGDERPSKHPA